MDRQAIPGELQQGDAMNRMSLLILALYLIGTIPPLLQWSLGSRNWLPLTIHVGALAVTWFIARYRSVPGFLRNWAPLLLVPLLYVELRWVIAGAGRAHADALVAGWDLRVFGSALTSTLATSWHSLALSEALHLAYLSYYAIVYVPPALLWWKGRHREFAATVLAIVIMYTVCFLAFVLFPVDGPRFLVGPSAAPDGPIRAIVLQILASGSSRGTAFPSAHVAASVVAGLCALRFQRSVGVAIVVLTAGMMVGAVYGGYHYASDVVAGLATGLVAAAASRAAERAITLRSATPR